MRNGKLASVMVVVGAGLGMGQFNTPSAHELAVFEELAIQPDSRLAWSTSIGRIGSPQSSAEVAATCMQDSRTKRQLCGVRIDLTSDGASDFILVEERYILRLADAVAEIEVHAPRFLARRTGNSSCFGTGAFLQAMRTGAHFFNPSLCQMSDGFYGLSVSTGRKAFRFPGVTAKPFEDLLRVAAAELGAR